MSTSAFDSSENDDEDPHPNKIGGGFLQLFMEASDRAERDSSDNSMEESPRVTRTSESWSGAPSVECSGSSEFGVDHG